MKNKTFLSITVFAISLLIIPQVTFASWWKPNTWKIFNRKSVVKIEQKIVATSTSNNVISQIEKATTTPTPSQSSNQSVGAKKIEQKSEEAKKNDQSKEIEKLKKEVEALKTKVLEIKQLKTEVKKQSVVSAEKKVEEVKLSPAVPGISEEIRILFRQSYFNKYNGILLDLYPNHYENVSFFAFRLEASGDEPSIINGFAVEAIGTIKPASVRKIKIFAGNDRLLSEKTYEGGSVTLILPNNDRYSVIEPRGSRDYVVVADFSNDLHTEHGKTIGFSLKQVFTESNILGDLPMDSQFLIASTTKQ